MAVLHKSRAFVIDIAPYRETSTLLHVLCEHEGRIALVGRGLRGPRSRRSAPDAFSLVQITYSLGEHASIGNLNAFELERLFEGLRQRIEAYALANFWFEILRVAMQAREAPAALFTLTLELLDTLDDTARPISGAVPLFIRVAQTLGYAIDTRRCARCGALGRVAHFDVSIGIPLCAACATPSAPLVPIDACSVSLLSGAPLRSTLNPSAVLAILTLVERLFSCHLEHSFRSFPFVVRALTGG